MSSMEQIQGKPIGGRCPRPNHWRSKLALWASTASACSSMASKQAKAAGQGWGRRVTAAGMPLTVSAGFRSQGSRNDTWVSTARWGTWKSTAPTSMHCPSSGRRAVVSVSRISNVSGTVGRGSIGSSASAATQAAAEAKCWPADATPMLRSGSSGDAEGAGTASGARQLSGRPDRRTTPGRSAPSWGHAMGESVCAGEPPPIAAFAVGDSVGRAAGMEQPRGTGVASSVDGASCPSKASSG